MTRPPPQRLFLWLWRGYLRRYWPIMSVALVFMVVEGSTTGLLSYMMKPMFDQVLVGGDEQALAWVALAVMAIFTARAVTGVVQKVLLKRVSELSMGDMRQHMLEHFMRMDPAFHQEQGPGAMIQRVEGDVGAIGKVWTTLITGAGRDFVALISLFGVAVVIDWRWTLVALVGVPLLVVPTMALQRFVRDNAREARDICNANGVTHEPVADCARAMDEFG